jgi:hypothetical protein
MVWLIPALPISTSAKSEELGRERATLLFRKSQDPVGDFGIPQLQPGKFRSFGLIQPQEREFDSLGERRLERRTCYFAENCKMLRLTLMSPSGMG